MAFNPEVALLKDYKAARLTLERLEGQLEAFYMPLLSQALEKEDFAEVEALIPRIPADSRAAFFAKDVYERLQQLRQRGGR